MMGRKNLVVGRWLDLVLDGGVMGFVVIGFM